MSKLKHVRGLTWFLIAWCVFFFVLDGVIAVLKHSAFSLLFMVIMGLYLVYWINQAKREIAEAEYDEALSSSTD